MADKIWMKRVLFPLWLPQLLLSIVILGLSAFTLVEINDSQALKGDGGVGKVVDAGEALCISFSAYTIIAVIIEIILLARHKFHPVTSIVMQSIKTTIWTFFFVVSIMSAVETQSSGLQIFLAVALFAACLAQLIYASVIVHRYRKGTLHQDDEPLEEGRGPVFAYTGAYNQSETAYNPQGGAPPNPFKDPSRDASPAPAYRPEQPVGGANGYYNGRSYEMQ